MTNSEPIDDRSFATLVRILRKYFHTDVFDVGSVQELRNFYARPLDDQPDWTRQFKKELRDVLLGDAAGLDDDAIDNATYYSQSNDQDFLDWVWRQIFPDEPVPGREA